MPPNVFPFNRLRGQLASSLASLSFGCVLAFGTSGCASAGQYVWLSELPPAERAAITGDYVINLGDVVNIRVYEQDSLSGDFKIRRDGKIALPLAGEIVAAGKPPLQLSSEIEARLKQFVVGPRVTVNVTTSQPISVTVVGEVPKIGVVTLENPARLIEALGQSGGLNEFADPERIFVLRQFPSYKRIRFTWSDITHNVADAASFPLRTGDVIVVE